MTDFIITSNTLNFGGAERQRVGLCNALHAAGYQVRLHLLQEVGPLVEELDPGVDVVVRSSFRSVTRERPGTLLVTGSTNTEVAHGIFWKARNRASCGWVVAHHHPAAPDKAVFGRPLAAAIRRADGAIYLSTVHRRDHTAHQRLDSGRYWIVPNGAPQGEEPAERKPSSDEPVRMVFVGRLVASKRVDFLVGVLTEGLDDLRWTLDVYGEGPELERLTSQVPAKLKDLVHFKGWCHDVPRMLLTADVLVSPSLFEAQPMAILEAMAAGTAVVSSSVAAVPEMLDENAGIVVPANDEGMWRDALRQVLTDSALRKQLGDNARERARLHYSVEAMAAGYVTVRHELLNQHQVGRWAPQS